MRESIWEDYECEWTKPSFVDLNGKPVKKNKFDYPYSYDTYVVWKGDYVESKSNVVYSDRMFQWNSNKYNKCRKAVWGNQSQYFNQCQPKDIEKFLSLYFDSDIKLTVVMEGCNVSNGYPYWVFFYENKNSFE